MDPGRAGALLGEALEGADDGELFLERSESESFVFDDGRLKSAAYDSAEGFGLRVVAGERAASPMPARFPKRPSAAPPSPRPWPSAAIAASPRKDRATPTPSSTARRIPSPHPASPIRSACCRRSTPSPAARDPRVVQVMASLHGERRQIEILRGDGRLLRDVRPLVRINVQVTVEREGRRESRLFRLRRPRGFRGLDHPGKMEA